MDNDLISRAALLENYGLKNAVKYGNETAEQQHNSYSTLMLYEIADMIYDAPTVDAEPVRHGRWINKGYITTAYGSIDTGECSACGAVDVPIEPYDDYCPNCGAKMDGDKDADY